jgi:hypothetical protein
MTAMGGKRSNFEQTLNGATILSTSWFIGYAGQKNEGDPSR